MNVTKAVADIIPKKIKRVQLSNEHFALINKSAKRYTSSSFVDDLTKRVNSKAPSKLKNMGGILVPKSDNIFTKVVEGVQDLFEMPFDFLNGVVRRFNHGKGIPFYEAHIQKEREIKALEGLYEIGKTSGKNFFKPFDEVMRIAEKTNKKADKIYNDYHKEFIDGIYEKYITFFNKTMDPASARYDTKKERLMTRLVSGTTAAIFLGKDFYNKAKLKGKSDKEAKQSQHLKQTQEIKENIIEGLLQFGTFALFTRAVNSKIWASAVIGAVIGVISKVASRKSSNMRITRVDVPQNSLKEFENSIKKNEPYKTQDQIDKKAKKPVLNIKTIGKIFAGAVVAGYILDFAKGKAFKNPKIKAFIDKIVDKDLEDIIASKEDLRKIAKILKKNGESYIGKHVSTIAEERVAKKGKSGIKIAKVYKKVKIGNIEVLQKDIKSIPLLPFKIIKEVASYPYKLFSKFINAIIDGNSAKEFKSKFIAKNKYAPEGSFKAQIVDFLKRKKVSTEIKPEKDYFEIKNIYIQYKKFQEKFGNDPKKLEEEFGKFIQDARLDTLNNKTVSKVDNSKIAVIASAISTLAGMWFNMNDEFNSSIKNGETKHEAEISARKRGLNKFARTTSQIAISGTLNSLFRQMYSASILYSSIIVAVSTIITDYVCRLLTAMPTKKMATKDDIEQFQKEHKNGKMAWYYKLIDKLAS